MPALGLHYQAIADHLQKICRIIEDELFSDSAVVNELCEHLQAYRGKMLRPALLLLCGEACGGITEEHLTLGAVLEIVHMATLVHDDVLDEADLRRRRADHQPAAGQRGRRPPGDYSSATPFHLCRHGRCTGVPGDRGDNQHGLRRGTAAGLSTAATAT